MTPRQTAYGLVAALLLALSAAGAWYWWQRGQAAVPAPGAAAPAASPVAETPASEAPAVAAAPGIQHPIEALGAAEPADVSFDVASALAELFGKDTTLRLFQMDNFAERVVATIDNLGRAHAAPRLWPLAPAQGRFTVARQGDAEVISADNDLRYTPYVLMIETVDLRRLVALYVRLYPRFQRAYEELGYPQRYFNDRVVEVIDQLLATPEPTGPHKVRLPAITGPVQPQQPWVLYEFEDPALQSLKPGQKILVRMGPVNQRRVKARLAEIRRLLTSAPPPR
jgi:Protein of unknown function (DUF3014)